MSFWVLEYRYADMDARARIRPDHLAYMTGLHAAGTVVYAGPVGDGSGALVLIDAPDEAAAQQVVDNDPYTAGGVGADHVLRPWNAVIGGPTPVSTTLNCSEQPGTALSDSELP